MVGAGSLGRAGSSKKVFAKNTLELKSIIFEYYIYTCIKQIKAINLYYIYFTHKFIRGI